MKKEMHTIGLQGEKWLNRSVLALGYSLAKLLIFFEKPVAMQQTTTTINKSINNCVISELFCNSLIKLLWKCFSNTLL